VDRNGRATDDLTARCPRILPLKTISRVVMWYVMCL